MTMLVADEELSPSKLGQKSHWDEVYDRESRLFNDVGDEGEVWFGESSVSMMRAWAEENLHPSAAASSSSTTSQPLRIIECGSGNGTLLLSFLTSPANSTARSFHLTGIDYSPQAAILAAGVEAARRKALKNGTYEWEDDEEGIANEVPPVDWRTGDLLNDEYQEEWDLVLDKGTFDALCLSDEAVESDPQKRLPSRVYPEKVSKLVKNGGYFLITSCNFTEEEIRQRWTVDGLGLAYHSSIPHPKFSFGGSTGSTICTVAFQKISDGSTVEKSRTLTNGTLQTNGDSVPVNGDVEPLCICVDAGGTKTDIAIATKGGVVARAAGGTGNMAEVGLQMCYEIITIAVLDAVANLPDHLKPKPKLANGSVTTRCPVQFSDVWVGISGCDTELDQERMSDLLSPFFGIARTPILNDAHLLGGALLTHHCPWGVAVIAGTGSIAIGLEVDKDGEVLQTGRRGGVGYLLGDDGSAFDLGRAAIRVAIDTFDAGEEVEGGLAQAIREHFGVKQTGEVLFQVYDLDPSMSPIDATNVRKLRISSLSRAILTAFTQPIPDPLAVQAVKDAARPLINSIVSLVKQNEKTASGLTGRPRLASQAALMMAGGVIRQPAYRQIILDSLRAQGIVFGVEHVVDDVAAEGAMGLVARAEAKTKTANGA